MNCADLYFNKKNVNSHPWPPGYAFITRIEEQFSNEIERVIGESLNFTLNLNADDPNKISVIDKHGASYNVDSLWLGSYYVNDGVFQWGYTRETLYDILEEKYKLSKLFGKMGKNDPVLKAIFSPCIKISYLHHMAIPIFIKSFHPSLNLIRFDSTDSDGKDISHYAMVRLGIKENLNYNDIDNALAGYRMMAAIMINKKSSVKKPSAKKSATKKSPVKKPSAKKSATKKPSAKKSATKKPATKKK